jgi:pimeloyl-ACP methyl ester carboxylesterase
MHKKIIYLIVLLLVSIPVFALEAEVMEGIANKEALVNEIIKSKAEGTIIVKKSTEEFNLEQERNQIKDDKTCSVVLLYQKDINLHIIYNKKCKLEKEDFNFLNNLNIGKDHNKGLEYIVRRVVDLLGGKPKESERTALEVKLEENDEGNEFTGLIGMYENSIDVIIYYPTKYDSSIITYTSNERGGSIELEDSGCTIEYKLREHDLEEVELGGKKREIKRIRGKLYLWDDRYKKPNSGILLSYSRRKGTFSSDVTDTLEVTMKCKGYEETKTKDILVSYKPVVIFVTGLWTNPKKQGFLDSVWKARYGNRFAFLDYFDTNLKEIESNAVLLEEEIVSNIQRIEKEELIKVGKVGIVGHSMGGLIARELASKEDSAQRIRRVVTLGSPLLGAPQIDLLYAACPYDHLNLKDPRCKDYKYMIDQFRDLIPVLPEGFGGIGPATLQMRPLSDFIREREEVKLYTKFTFVAGTKPNMPSYLAESPYIKNAVLFVGWALRQKVPIVSYKVKYIKIPIVNYQLIDIPKSMKGIFKQLLLSLIQEGTDGTVPIDSALWKVYEQKDGKSQLIHAKSMRRRLPLNHGDLTKKEPGQSLARLEIKESRYTLVGVASPVNIYVYDDGGNLVGLKEGELKEEIPNAKLFIDEESESQSILIEDDKNYKFIIEATDNGSFSFSVNQRQEDKELAIYYEDVKITDETKASFELTKGSEEHILKVDVDGDGIVDKELEPDFLQEVDIEIEELDYVRSGNIETDFERPKSKFWIWALGAVVLVIILLILFIRKRHYSQSI